MRFAPAMIHVSDNVNGKLIMKSIFLIMFFRFIFGLSVAQFYWLSPTMKKNARE